MFCETLAVVIERMSLLVPVRDLHHYLSQAVILCTCFPLYRSQIGSPRVFNRAAVHATSLAIRPTSLQQCAMTHQVLQCPQHVCCSAHSM